MDNFQSYLKKQLLDYVESERKRGIPLEQIEKVLLDAGHHKNIIDEVFLELEKETATNKQTKHKNPVEKDLVSMLKQGFEQFMMQATTKEVKTAKKEFKKTNTTKIVKQVINEAEIIEEKFILESIFFFSYLIILGFLILLTAGSTDSNIVSVAIGFSPAVINAFISFLSIKLADLVPLYVMIPLLTSSGFYVLGKFLDFFQAMDIEALAVVNFLFGFFFNVIMVYLKFVKPRSMKKRIIKKPKNKSTQVQSKHEINELKKEFNV